MFLDSGFFFLFFVFDFELFFPLLVAFFQASSLLFVVKIHVLQPHVIVGKTRWMKTFLFG